MNNTNKLPYILSLQPQELIEWCNKRKKEMRLSNAKLADLTNVPEGTIDRIFTGKNPEFRYSTIQPIVAYLIKINEETPEPSDPNNVSELKYYDTIEGYKLIVANKNHVIDELKKSFLKLQQENDYLKKFNIEKQKIIVSMQEHTKWLEKLIDKNNGIE